MSQGFTNNASPPAVVADETTLHLSGTTLSVLNNGVGNAQLAQMAAGTIKGNNISVAANAADLSASAVVGLLRASSAIAAVAVSGSGADITNGTLTPAKDAYPLATYVQSTRPSSPSNGDVWLDTTLNSYWSLNSSAAKWLSVEIYSYPVHFEALASGSTSLAYFPSLTPQGYYAYVIGACGAYFVNTTNNGSNYWNFILNEFTAGNVYTAIGSANSSASSVGQWYQLLISSAADLGPFAGMQVDIAATGSPGTLYGSLLVKYRLEHP